MQTISILTNFTFIFLVKKKKKKKKHSNRRKHRLPTPDIRFGVYILYIIFIIENNSKIRQNDSIW